MQTSLYVQQRDARWRWRTVTTADSRPIANGMAEELRRALVASPHSPVAAVRVVDDIELAHEMRSAAEAMSEGDAAPTASLG